MDRRFKDYSVHDSPPIVDSGYASIKNINIGKRRKEHFLAALKSKPKGLKLLDRLAPHIRWKIIGDGVYASSLIRDRLKWVVIWNDDVARRNGDGKMTKIVEAVNEPNTHSANIGKGRVKSSSEKDRKTGTIFRKYGVRRFIQVKGGKRLAFTMMESASVVKSE